MAFPSACVSPAPAAMGPGLGFSSVRRYPCTSLLLHISLCWVPCCSPSSTVHPRPNPCPQAAVRWSTFPNFPQNPAPRMENLRLSEMKGVSNLVWASVNLYGLSVLVCFKCLPQGLAYSRCLAYICLVSPFHSVHSSTSQFVYNLPTSPDPMEYRL